MKVYDYAEVIRVIPCEVNGDKLQLNVAGTFCFYSKEGFYSVGDCLKIDRINNKVFKV